MHNEDEIELVEIRPRFRLQSSLAKEDVFNRIKNLFKSGEFEGKHIGDHIHIKIIAKNQHYWSPEIGIDCESNDEGTLIRCLIGPKQTVWAMFLFMYGAISILGLFGSMYGLTLWQLNKGTAWLWTFPIAVLLLIIVFIAAKTGQKIGHDQMVLLVRSLHNSLGKENFKEIIIK